MNIDVFTSLQLSTDNQNLQNVTQNNASDSEPGLFAAIINEITEENNELIPIDEIIINGNNFELLNNFSANNKPFNQSIIDILTNNTEEIMPENEIINVDNNDNTEDIVIWPEDEIKTDSNIKSEIINEVKNFIHEKINLIESAVNDADIDSILEEFIADFGLDEKINDIPEEFRNEIEIAINDIVSELKHEDKKESQPVIKIMAALTEKISPKNIDDKAVKINNDDENDSDDEDSEIDINSESMLIGMNPPENPEIINQSSKTEHHTITSHKPNIESQTQPEFENTQIQRNNTQESQPVTNKFSEAIENRNENISTQTENETNTQNQNENKNENNNNNNFSQPQEQNNSRFQQRSNTRINNPRTRNENSSSSSTQTHRTESHSDFQTFFEGVLAGRRTISTSSQTPLNLRGTANFSQPVFLRDGITNVVRFIRADGIHKANIIVDPPALGRISVELTSSNSGVEASIKVASEQIRNLVQDQISQLRMNLSQQGVQVTEFTVDVQQDNSGHQNPNNQENQELINFADIAEENDTEEFRIDLEDGLLYWVA